MLLDGSIVDQTQILMLVLGIYEDLTYIRQYHKMICNIIPKTKLILLISIFWACTSVQTKISLQLYIIFALTVIFITRLAHIHF